ncbi:hypothetical protein AOLI_G00129900 [Acnodon oligacanthus]
MVSIPSMAWRLMQRGQRGRLLKADPETGPRQLRSRWSVAGRLSSLSLRRGRQAPPEPPHVRDFQPQQSCLSGERAAPVPTCDLSATCALPSCHTEGESASDRRLFNRVFGGFNGHFLPHGSVTALLSCQLQASGCFGPVSPSSAAPQPRIPLSPGRPSANYGTTHVCL